MTNDRPILQVFEPAMCCSTGVCGPDVDPALVAFASDVKWLKDKGVEVQRFNLGQVPAAFIENPLVYESISASGVDELPLVVVGGQIVMRRRYPARDELAEIAGIAEPAPRAAASAPSPARDIIELDVTGAPAPSPADDGIFELDVTGSCGDGNTDCC
jgi:hypothetical protein